MKVMCQERKRLLTGSYWRQRRNAEVVEKLGKKSTYGCFLPALLFFLLFSGAVVIIELVLNHRLTD